jgi:membrane protease YdiL (CAAX protease family)
VVAALGVTIVGAIVIFLSLDIWRSAGGRQPLSPRVMLGLLSLNELSFLYFGFRRLKANRKKGVTPNLLEGNTRRGVLSGIAVGIALIAISVVYSISVQKLFHVALPNPLEILGDAKGNLPLSLTFVSIASILAPTCEEFFFRGIIFGSAQAINRSGLGVVVTSLLFAFVHLSLVLSPYYILWSIATCWLFARCRTIIGPVAAHMTVNAAGCLAIVLSR